MTACTTVLIENPADAVAAVELAQQVSDRLGLALEATRCLISIMVGVAADCLRLRVRGHYEIVSVAETSRLGVRVAAINGSPPPRADECDGAVRVDAVGDHEVTVWSPIASRRGSAR